MTKGKRGKTNNTKAAETEERGAATPADAEPVTETPRASAEQAAPEADLPPPETTSAPEDEAPAGQPPITPEPRPELRPEAKPERRGTGTALALLALLLGAGAAGGAYLVWTELQQIRQAQSGVLQQTQDRLGQLDTRQQGQQRQAEQLATQLTGQLEEQADRLARLDAQLAQLGEQQDDLREALAALGRERGDTEDELALAEVNALVTLASHRLLLTRDLDTSIAALGLAERRLREATAPALFRARQVLVRDLTNLQAVPRPDLAGVALELSALAEAVPGLPVSGTRISELGTPAPSEERGEAPPGEGWRGFLGAVWEDLKGLVVIRRDARLVTPLLAPDQQYFLQQNVRLKLEQARLALLQGEPGLYRDALTTAAAWIGDHFDTDAQATRHVLQSIERLATLELFPELPDLSASLRALREAAGSMGQGTAGAR